MHKIAFEIGGLTIHWYGVLVAIGFLLALWSASRRASKENVSPDLILDLGPWIVLAGILGARILYVLSHWTQEFARDPLPEIFMVHHGGLVFYGGFLGASLATAIYARVKGLDLWKLADLLAPSIALGQTVGRMGCLMNGCCYGEPTKAPWGIRFPANHETFGTEVHPTQMYEALATFALFLVLASLYRYRRYNGQIFVHYVIWYAALRFLIEAFRGDYAHYYLKGLLTPGQILSGALFIAGIFLAWWLTRSVKGIQSGEG